MPAGANDRRQARLIRRMGAGFRGSIVPAAICITFAVVVTCRATAQTPSPPAGLRTDRLDRPAAIAAPPDANAQMLVRQRRMRHQDFERINAARRQQIGDASDKLLVLAIDLRSRVAKAGNDPVPPIVIREADVIERLAREVQQKMALTVGVE